MNSPKIPYIFGLLVLLSALFGPFWLTASIYILAIYFLPRFYFGIVVFFIMDSLYGFKTLEVGPFYGMLTIFGIAAYVLLTYIKKMTFISRNRI